MGMPNQELFSMADKPKETLNPFEVAQRQIDRVGKRLKLDPGLLEETCHIFHRPSFLRR